MLYLILVAFSLAGGWLLMKWNKVKSFWADRGVPHSPPHPLLGSLTFIRKENPAYWLRSLYNAKIPYVGVWLFWRPCLVVNSPELARRILVKDADNFRNRHLNSGRTDPLGRLNLFTVNDPLWGNLRKRLTPVFTAAKLRSLQGLLRVKSLNLVERIEGDMRKNNVIADLRMTCSDYTSDVIGESAFGVKSESTRTGDSAIRRVTTDMMHFTAFRSLSWTSIFFWPQLVDVFRFKFFPEDSMSCLKQLFRTVVEQRGGLDKEVIECRDLLDALLKLRQEAAFDKEELSEDLLLAQAAVFLLAGFDTSGTALTWAIYELAHQPELQEKLHKELVEAKETYGTENLDTTQLAELKYLNAVLKETLRKYPPMGWLDRIAAHEYKIDENLTLPAGSIMYVNAYGMQMDEEHFALPETFDPDRFLPENEVIKPFTYMPFGEGPRSCIGKRYAYQTLRVGLASIFLRYTVRPGPHAVAPKDVLVDRKGMFLTPAEKLAVLFRARE